MKNTVYPIRSTRQRLCLPRAKFLFPQSGKDATFLLQCSKGSGGVVGLKRPDLRPAGNADADIGSTRRSGLLSPTSTVPTSRSLPALIYTISRPTKNPPLRQPAPDLSRDAARPPQPGQEPCEPIHPGGGPRRRHRAPAGEPAPHPRAPISALPSGSETTPIRNHHSRRWSSAFPVDQRRR
jgi:hypothetical protein